MLAEGHTITNTCLALGMSVSSAYALRRSARGAAFALGWPAALLLAREHLADKLLERAVHGSVETITRPDGSTITRQRHDNRLATHMLTRLDRLADQSQGPADHAAARLAAAEFEQYLDLVGCGGGAARAGLFLARRLAGAADTVEAATDDLAPVRALARADAWLRGQADSGAAVAIGDLDPAQRGDWTAEQWARAEAAGLLVLAPAPPAEDTDMAYEHELPQLHDHAWREDQPVWWCEIQEDWRTHFPPPETGFDGDEDGIYGNPAYSRALTAEEREAIEAPLREERAAQRAAAAAARDAFFADIADEEAEAVEPAPTLPPDAAPGRSAAGAGAGDSPSARPAGTRKRRTKASRAASSGRRGRSQSAGVALQSVGQAPT